MSSFAKKRIKRSFSQLNKRHTSTEQTQVKPINLANKVPPAEHLFLILSNPNSAYFFHKFLVKRFASESLSFWIAVEKYQTLCKQKQKTEAENLGNIIIKTYFSTDSTKQVNLDTDVKRLEFTNFDSHTFDELKERAWQLLVSMDYPPFILSKEYQDYLGKGRNFTFYIYGKYLHNSRRCCL